MCRLTDFQLISEHGEKQALESADLDSKPLFITGLCLLPVMSPSCSVAQTAHRLTAVSPGFVHPCNGPMKKDLAWKAVKFGPITAWSVSCDAAAAQASQHAPCTQHLHTEQQNPYRAQNDDVFEIAGQKHHLYSHLVVTELVSCRY